MSTLLVTRNHKNSNGWEERHNQVVVHLNGPYPLTNSLDTVVAMMLETWKLYAEFYQSRFESKIGDDGVLGECWKDIGLGIRGLLNGELGRLDAGTLDAFILDTLREHGILDED